MRTWATMLIGVAVVIIATGLSFHRLGVDSLMGDESIYAIIARRAVVEGHWYPPMLDQKRFRGKPPLVGWAMALSFQVGGLTERSVRIGSAIGAVLTALLVFVIGTRLADARAGAIAAVLLATSPIWLFMHGAREGVGDVWLTLYATAALLLYVRYRATASRAAFAGAVAAAAIGSLIKGPIPQLLLLGIGIVWETCIRVAHRRGEPPSLARLGPARWTSLFSLVLISSGPYALWIADEVRRDRGFIALLHKEWIVRATKAVDPGHVQGLLFYPRVLWWGFGLWLVAVLVSLLWMRRWSGSPERDGLALLLPIWAAFPILLFLPSVSKLSWYIDPALPAIVLLTGIGVWRVTSQFKSRLVRGALTLLVVALLGIRTGRAWRATSAPPRLIQMHRAAMALRTVPSARLEVDGMPTLREWNRYYLHEMKYDRHPGDLPGCTLVVTMHPESYGGAPSLHLDRIDPRESDVYLVDRCGGAVFREMEAGAGG